ncbi:hypothetical protein L1987_15773 [Smallanthus sonchifolius]|uniref:Uncharacterized protein n=1 Tax=Smallanthus sonchifolius TaxID=185202 RepID=A0ACB9J8L5_9ASTR|nr:hypothetical protein L1987_15773 [Smallanthus sonchifolius]
MLAHLVQQDRDARQRLDAPDTLLKNQQSAFQDLQRTVGDIAKSLKDKQGGPYSGPNASLMVVSVMSNRKEERVDEKVSHVTNYGITSPEEVKKIDWRARFAEIDARMLEEPESAEVKEPGTSVNVVSTRSRRVEENESPPVEEEPVDEEMEMEKPAEKA